MWSWFNYSLQSKNLLLARGCDSEIYTCFKFLLAVLKQGRMIDSCSLIKLINLQRLIAPVLIWELQDVAEINGI